MFELRPKGASTHLSPLPQKSSQLGFIFCGLEPNQANSGFSLNHDQSTGKSFGIRAVVSCPWNKPAHTAAVALPGLVVSDGSACSWHPLPLCLPLSLNQEKEFVHQNPQSTQGSETLMRILRVSSLALCVTLKSQKAGRDLFPLQSREGRNQDRRPPGRWLRTDS